MVSENIFLSANHYFPVNGTSVSFYTSNDPSGGHVTRSIQSSPRIGTSDLRIGTLNAGQGSGFNFYNFATENIASFASIEALISNAKIFSPFSMRRSSSAPLDVR